MKINFKKALIKNFKIEKVIINLIKKYDFQRKENTGINQQEKGYFFITETYPFSMKTCKQQLYLAL